MHPLNKTDSKIKTSLLCSVGALLDEFAYTLQVVTVAAVYVLHRMLHDHLSDGTAGALALRHHHQVVAASYLQTMTAFQASCSNKEIQFQYIPGWIELNLQDISDSTYLYINLRTSRDCLCVSVAAGQLRLCHRAALFTYFGEVLHCPHKRIVTITKVYIARNNIHVELIRFRKK